MTDYYKKIIEGLAAIEQEEGVRILYACESGSRAWGFPSKDSDYDVRFIYIRPVEWYLSIFDRRDVIERPISNMLDMNGWDLKKTLNLFKKSNPTLLEWLQSPISYMEPFSTAGKIRGLCALTFSPRSCLYHYLHMARVNYRVYLQSAEVRIKKYFYVLRPILACDWIERYQSMPPIQFDLLVERLVPSDSELKAVIEQLLERKKAGDELDYEPRINPINEYLEQRIAYFENATSAVPASQSWRDEELDELFRSALQEVYP
ncbi:hypothetical protein PAECIP111893_04188 [Paenibacillus plantiphilus]|uniref:Nucleotidyltransferase n=1 Tax=Paenibacillus plantiphilus TaxID=2905650 RepID=A0ABN8GSE4_9BACL|nr:nucleotidyltransferase domain-containing protein [Paenibacillus plantiphilus]CAH1216849.1 hypothetical protein PAECIP111893_04188 [Paenibacillus plantiphilus]